MLCTFMTDKKTGCLQQHAIDMKNKTKTNESMDDENDDMYGPLVKKQKILETTNKLQKRDVFSDLNCNNIIKYYENLQRGNSIQRYRHSVKLSLINQIKSFKVAKAETPFDRRVTYIEWHPINPKLVAIASKSGDIILWNYDKAINTAFMVKGIGAGGSVQAMKFDLNIPHKVYTVSIEGKFLVLDFKTKKAEQFLDTSDFKKWYVSLDINWGSKTMVVGDNKGELTILTLEGEVTDRIKLHKASCRISHAEFSKREPWLLCTTSTDYTVKLWDIRQLRKEKTGLAVPLRTIEHRKGLNAAYFSLTDGCRLLTTDQFDKICVYRSPLWNLETEINHPHRQYQHLTPIRAYWHPLEDIIVVGRYPHIKFPGYVKDELRTIDFFDADTGELFHQHSESGFNGIAPLNRFNVTGDTLASGTGTKILIWKPTFKTGIYSHSPDKGGNDIGRRMPMRKESVNSTRTTKLKKKEAGLL